MSFPAVTRGPLAIDRLLWVRAKNRTSGAEEAGGLWSGAGDLSITIDGEARLYRGGGSILTIDDLVSQEGAIVQHQSVRLSGIAASVLLLARQYDMRDAPCEIHIRRTHPETGALLSVSRVFKGYVETQRIITGEKGGTSTVDLSLVSTARNLTRKVALRRSDASHQRAQAADRFFQHCEGNGSIWWGQIKHDAGSAG